MQRLRSAILHSIRKFARTLNGYFQLIFLQAHFKGASAHQDNPGYLQISFGCSQIIAILHQTLLQWQWL